MTENNILFTTLPLILVLFFHVGKSQKIPISTTSNDALAYYNKADSLENMMQLDSAKQYYLAACKTDSTFALSWLRAAMVLDNFDDRKFYLAKAMENLAFCSYGEKLWILGRHAFYGQGADQSNEFISFRRLQNLYPKDPKSNYLYAYVNNHHGQNNNSVAIQYHKKAIALDSNYSKPYNELCYVYMDAKNYDSALLAIRGAINLLPNNPNAYDSYAEIFLRMGNYKQSIKAYEKVLAIDQTFPWAFMGLAANYNYIGDFRQAQKYLSSTDTLIMSDYQYRHAWRGKVVSYLEEELIDSAINVLRKQRRQASLRSTVHEPNFHQYYGYLRATRLLFESNQTDDGLLEYQHWTTFCKSSLKPSSYERVKNLNQYYQAFAAYNRADFKAAIDGLNAYFDDEKEPSNIIKTLKARILMSLNRNQEAINIFENMPALDYSDRYWYAIALKSNDQKKQALDNLHLINSANEINNIDLALVRKKSLKLFAELAVQ